jgi:hypothetical protein
MTFELRTLGSLAATVLAGAFLVTGCTSASDADGGMTTPTESESEVIMDVTDEQVAFVEDLLATPLPQEEATARIEEAGYVWRLGTIDGEPQAVTMDYRTDRLTLTTQDGLVIDATWG